MSDSAAISPKNFLALALRLVALLTRIFTDADEDGSGWLTVHEFVEALRRLFLSSGCEIPLLVDDYRGL